MKFRKIPIEIDAIQWTGDNLKDVIDFTGLHPSANKWSWQEYEEVVRKDGLKIFTIKGPRMASIGDWIIRTEVGDLCTCEPDVFAATYEPVNEHMPPEPNITAISGECTLPIAIKDGRYVFTGSDGNFLVGKFEIKNIVIGSWLFLWEATFARKDDAEDYKRILDNRGR